MTFKDISKDCTLCPRLRDFREVNRTMYPNWHNAPVSAFGDLDARLLIVGLAPGLKGANCTGRPFTGDFAGDLLYPTLLSLGFAKGVFSHTDTSRADAGALSTDGLSLVDVRITNAVRCVPPQNKPTPQEIKTCGVFLKQEIAAMKNLKAVLCLGRVAHEAVLTTFEMKKSLFPFAHDARHALEGGLALFDSYHCSRYNTNTGRLTETMFRDVFAGIARYLNQ